jgi:hypothetical protein
MKIFEILEKIKNYDKLQAEYDKLNDDFHQIKIQCDEQQVHLQSYNLTLRITNQELEEKKGIIKRLKEKINLTKEQPLYNEISKPDLSIKQIEASMKLVDKFTLNQIIHYLKLDTFELVKNIA